MSNGYQAARMLGMNPQQAELALQASRKIPKAQLLAGLRALQKADDRLKGGAHDVRAVMGIPRFRVIYQRSEGRRKLVFAPASLSSVPSANSV